MQYGQTYWVVGEPFFPGSLRTGLYWAWLDVSASSGGANSSDGWKCTNNAVKQSSLDFFYFSQFLSCSLFLFFLHFYFSLSLSLSFFLSFFLFSFYLSLYLFVSFFIFLSLVFVCLCLQCVYVCFDINVLLCESVLTVELIDPLVNTPGLKTQTSSLNNN